MLHQIELGHEETDINIVLPQGQIIQLQYRLESPSIDVCLPEPTSVTNWIGDDMEPAPLAKRKTRSHVHEAQQLMIDINPKFVDTPEELIEMYPTKTSVIASIRKASLDLNPIQYKNILFEFNLQSFSEKMLEEMNLTRLEDLICKIERMI